MTRYYPIFLLAIAVASHAFASVTVTSPAANSTVTSPVQYVATATTSTCSKGVASMGIYVNNKLIYTVKGTSLNTSLTLAAGAEHTVVEEWDYCGGASYTTINLTVKSSTPQGPTVSIQSSPTSISEGESSTLTVTASNATQVTVSGSDGNTYNLQPSGGTQVVTPSSTTTYTAEATGAGGNASATTTVTVGSSGGLQSINHVIFMLQENHSFDNYFGMLNPYRRTNGWNVGDDGQVYTIDGIDDKLNTSATWTTKAHRIPLFKLKTTCIDDDYVGVAGELWRCEPLQLPDDAADSDGWLCAHCGRFCEELRCSGTCSGNFHRSDRPAGDGILRSEFSELLLLHGVAVCGVRPVVLAGVQQERSQSHCDLYGRHNAGAGVRPGKR